MGSLLRLLNGRLPAEPLVLDVGSGPGYDAAALVRRRRSAGGRWVLLDPQRSMWESSRGLDRVAGRSFRPDRVLGDAVDLPVRSARVDLLLSVGVLCCTSDAAVPAAVSESVRVLRPGGWLLFGVPRWRGAEDDDRWRSAGLTEVASVRPGRTLFRKPL